MKYQVLVITALLSSSQALAQDDPTGGDVLPPCDWFGWIATPDALSGQPGWDEVARGWNCRADQAVVDYIWRGFNFDYQSWAAGDGNGWSEPCNPTYPIGRTLVASVLLGYSGAVAPNCNFNGNNMLDWALCWAASRYSKLHATCYQYDRSVGGRTYWVAPFGTETVLYPLGIYMGSVAGMAGTLIHEARHYDCGHNIGDDGCLRGGSCDETWNDGCESVISSQAGANRYEIVWMSWFANRGSRGGPIVRLESARRANEILSTGYNHDPCFRVAMDGTPVDIQAPGC